MNLSSLWTVKTLRPNHNSMETHFRHWIKNKNAFISKLCLFSQNCVTQLRVRKSVLRDINPQLREKKVRIVRKKSELWDKKSQLSFYFLFSGGNRIRLTLKRSSIIAAEEHACITYLTSSPSIFVDASNSKRYSYRYCYSYLHNSCSWCECNAVFFICFSRHTQNVLKKMLFFRTSRCLWVIRTMTHRKYVLLIQCSCVSCVSTLTVALLKAWG